jgi:hypothetical protein
VIERIRENFGIGISRIKWFAAVFADRLKIEVAVIRLLYRSAEMEKKKAGLLRNIGTRVYELRANPDRNILKDKTVIEAVEALVKLEKEMEELKQKASEMSSVET